jgi:hypothetical protein
MCIFCHEKPGRACSESHEKCIKKSLYLNKIKEIKRNKENMTGFTSGHVYCKIMSGTTEKAHNKDD